MDGLIIMPRVFINLLYTYTMPNNHYSTTYMLPYPHLLAKHCLRVGRKSRSEARNLPTCGCKSMMDGLIIMPRVFINLLYTYTMPNNHYYSQPTSLRCHLMAKCLLRVGKKSRSEARNLPTRGCKSMMDGLTIILRVFINLLYTYTLYPCLYNDYCLN